MNAFQLLFHFVELYAIYLLYTTVKGLKLRMTNIEQKPKEQVPTKAPQPTVKADTTALGKFKPPTLETISPAEKRMRKVADGVYEI